MNEAPGFDGEQAVSALFKLKLTSHFSAATEKTTRG